MRQGGFTILELVVVIVIMGVLSAMALPNLEGISPKYRLRAAARSVGSKINWARSLAGGTSSRYVMHYDLDERRYWIVLPPGPEDDPDLPVEDREILPAEELADGIRFGKILLPDGASIEDGDVDILFDPLGHEGSHIVYLRNEDDGLICLKYNAILGVVDFSDEEEEFASF